MAVRPLDAVPRRALPPEAPPTRQPERRPHLEVVPPDYVSARARRRRARRLVVLGGVLVAVALFGVVAFHVVLTQGQLDLQHLQTRAAAASVREQQLRLEAARLESPERVVDDARRLGMVPPASVRYLSPDGRAPLPAPSTTVAPRPITKPVAPAPAAKPAVKPVATSVTAAAKPGTAKPAPPTTARTAVPTTALRPTR